MALICWNVAKDTVIQQGALELAQKYIPNPTGEFERIKGSYDMMIELSEKQAEHGDHWKKYAEKQFIEDSLQLIEISLSISNRVAATEIQTNALKVLNNERLKEAIPPAK